MPLTCVRAFFVCVFLSISLILCLSCAGSALCVRPVCLRLVGKVGRLLISPKNKPYLQAPLKPSVACVHVYLLPHPWGRIPPTTTTTAPPDSSFLPKTYGTCPQSAWPRWPPIGWLHGVPAPFLCQQPSGPLPFTISGDQAGGADKSGISRAHQHTIPQALQAS